MLKADRSSAAPLIIQFRSAAEKFRLIDDKGVSVVVPYQPEDADETPVAMWLTQLSQSPAETCAEAV